MTKLKLEERIETRRRYLLHVLAQLPVKLDESIDVDTLTTPQLRFLVVHALMLHAVKYLMVNPNLETPDD